MPEASSYVPLIHEGFALAAVSDATPEDAQRWMRRAALASAILTPAKFDELVMEQEKILRDKGVCPYCGGPASACTTEAVEEVRV